jgi:hypothetical protein
MRRPYVGFVTMLLLLPTLLSAKGATTRILILDSTLGTATEIRDRSVLEQFNVWAGRGTFAGAPGEEVESSQGFIIDWQAGVGDSQPGRLRRYEVRFYVGDRNSAAEALAYVVYYETDPLTREGYVYLPGPSDEHYRLNVRAIHRGNGVEGHWFRASRAWQRAVATLSVDR